MLDFIWKGLSLWSSSENYIHYVDEIVVVKNRKLQVINANFKKCVETEEIFIQMANRKWKNIEDVFGEKSLPRIRRKSKKFLKSSD